MKELFDISYVCKKLGITSRTLRFYEAKSLIQSTTDGFSSRRQYTEEQVAHIQYVLALRTLGLSVKSISALQKQNTELQREIFSRRAEIYASIHTKTQEINRLNQALATVEAGKDLPLFDPPADHVHSSDQREIPLINHCVNAILQNDTQALYPCFTDALKQALPQSTYEAIRSDTLSPLGDFCCLGKLVKDPHLPNVWIRYVVFRKLGLKITVSVAQQKIDGIWLGYYEIKPKEK